MNNVKQYIVRVLVDNHILATVICLLAYLNGYSHDQLNYFQDLAYSILHGRLNLLDTKSVQDLVLFDGKYYPYWPPAPALVFLPLVAVFGRTIPNGLVSAIFGVMNVWLVMRFCQRLSNSFFLNLPKLMILLIGIFWGLGTVQFYMSKIGSVWFIAQIIAQFFLLASFNLFITNKRTFLSGLFFGLAVYSRNHLVFSALFFAALYAAMNPLKNCRELARSAAIFLLPLFVFSILNAWYNYARFGSIFDNGLNYHLMADHFRNNFNRYGVFSIHYFPHNFYIEVLRLPVLTARWPFIKQDLEGFGMLWASPVFLLTIPAIFFWVYKLFKKDAELEYKLITSGSLFSTVGIAIPIFLLMGTGFGQFGARYPLDFEFLLLIFLLFSWKYIARIPLAKLLTFTLLLLSIAVETIGAMTYKG